MRASAPSEAAGARAAEVGEASPLAGVRRYARLYVGARRKVALCVVAAVGQSALLLPIPLLVKLAVDTGIPEGRASTLAVLAVAIVALHAAAAALSLWTRHVVLRVTKEVTLRLRGEILERFFSLSRSFRLAREPARLATVLVQDVERIDAMSNTLVAQFLPSALVAGGLALVVVYLDPWLALLAAALAPFLLAVNRVLAKDLRRSVRDFRVAMESLSAGSQRLMRHMDLFQAQTAREDEGRRQRRTHDAVREAGERTAYRATVFAQAHAVVASAIGAAVLAVGGVRVAQGAMTLGDLLSFFAAIGLLRQHLRTGTNSVPDVLAGLDALSVVDELLREGEPEPYAGTQEVPLAEGIELERVGFAYGESPVLRDVSLRLSPGRRTAVVGPNGAGKSTLIHLLVGFYRPSSGRILADGVSYELLDIAALRRSIGLVPQEAVLLPLTVAENVALGCPEATPARIAEALELATADRVVARLPQGLATELGEDGLRLSGGERQRLAIARALVRAPRFLILDEPTNHLDAQSVAGFLAGLDRLPTRPAVLIVTHDEALLPHVDEVVRLPG